MAASVWRGRLTFGLVSVPVRLYKAARRERIRFHHVYRPAPATSEAEGEIEEFVPPPAGRGVREVPARAQNREVAPERARDAEPEDAPEPEPVARVHTIPIGSAPNSPIERPQILKGHEIEKGRYVTFEPSEIAALRPRTSTEIGIAEFVRLNEIDPLYFETSYYVVPDTGGEKAYAILFRALSEAAYAAVGSLAMHGREHAVVIRPGKHGLILHTLFYAGEVHAEQEYRSDPQLAGTKETEMARLFIQALAAPFDASKLKDTFEERLRGLIESRASTASAEVTPGEARKPAPVIDIMDALRRSLELARKPVQTDVALAEKKPKSRRRRGA